MNHIIKFVYHVRMIATHCYRVLSMYCPHQTTIALSGIGFACYRQARRIYQFHSEGNESEICAVYAIALCTSLLGIGCWHWRSLQF